MNKNQIITRGFSNPESQQKFESAWADEPEMRARYENGWQCGGCGFYAPFNTDWGLCCHEKSRHHLETVFEHFSCPVYVAQGWEEHSFTDFNELPVAKREYERKVEIPEHIYKRIEAIAKSRDELPIIVILSYVFPMLEKLLNDETPDNPAES